MQIIDDSAILMINLNIKYSNFILRNFLSNYLRLIFINLYYYYFHYCRCYFVDIKSFISLFFLNYFLTKKCILKYCCIIIQLPPI